MIEEILVNGVCAFMGTVGFAMMFNVPKRYYLSCGMTGAVGWLVYKGVHVYASSAVASFLAALMVVLISRMLTVRMKCPITIFLVSGIIPLVPGAGVYYPAYYLVMNQLSMAAQKGMESIKIAFGIVLGIAFIISIPREAFQMGYWRQKIRLRKIRLRRNRKNRLQG